MKVVPKLPDPTIFLQKSEIKRTDFFSVNERRYNAPFLIFSRKLNLDDETAKKLTIGNCNEFENIPHAHELLTLYQDFHAQAFPKKEICLLKKKCKCFLLDLILPF